MPTSETSRLSSANSESQKGSSRLTANWQLLLSLVYRVKERLQQVRASRQEVVDAMPVHQTQAILERHIKRHGNQIARHGFRRPSSAATLSEMSLCDTTPITALPRIAT